VPVRPEPDPAAGAGHQLDAERHRRRVDVQDPAGGQVPQRRAADRRRRGLHLQAAERPDGQVERAVGVRRCAHAGRGHAGRRPDGAVQAGRPERELPVPDVVRQLQHDHHPEQLRPDEVAEHVHRHRPLRARLVHAEGGRHVHPQRVVLGNQGAALADPVHLLRHPGRVGPRADRRDHRRPRAVRGERRRGAAQRQLQRDQAEDQRAPRAATRPRSPTPGCARPSRSP
jgi:hypothetical protein